MSFNKNNLGYEIVDTSEILKDVQDAFLSVFPELNTDPATPQGQIITAITEIIAEKNVNIIEHCNSFQNGGSGIYLDIRNKSFYGLTRKTASKGSVTVIIYGKAGISIPTGFKANDNNGNEFITISPYTIALNGEVYAEMMAVKDGEFTIEANTLTNIITKINGVDRINNPYASIKGTNIETDAEFRERANKSISFLASSTYDSLLAKLLQLDGVQKVSGRENTTNAVVEFKGVSLQPHSINTVIKGGDINEIGKIMQSAKAPGCYIGGDIIVDVYAANVDQTYTVRFYRPIPKKLKAEVKVHINSLTSQNYVELIQEQLINYINNNKIHHDIIPLNALAYINVENVTIVSFGLALEEADTVNITPIKLNFKDEAVIYKENIKVSIYE